MVANFFDEMMAISGMFRVSGDVLSMVLKQPPQELRGRSALSREMHDEVLALPGIILSSVGG
jgi:hypothetical protein